MDFDKLMDDLKGFGEDELQAIESAVSDFLHPMGPVVFQAAKDAVSTVAQEMAGATGAEKKDAAYGQIVSTLESQAIQVGGQVGASLINRMIEVAYSWFQKFWTDITTDTATMDPSAPK